MISIPVHHRKLYAYPRLYVKEDPSYRYTRVFVTKLGLISIGLAGLIGGLFTAFTIFLIN